MSEERALRDALETAQGSVRELKRQLDEARRVKAADVDEQLTRARRDLDAERARAESLRREADKAAQHLRELEREKVTNEHLRAELISVRQAASRARASEPPPAPEGAPSWREDLERHVAANAQLQGELNALKRDVEQSTHVKELLRLQNEVTGLRNQLARAPALRTPRGAEGSAPRPGVSPLAVASLVAAVFLYFSEDVARFAFGAKSAALLLGAAVVAQLAGRKK